MRNKPERNLFLNIGRFVVYCYRLPTVYYFYSSELLLFQKDYVSDADCYAVQLLLPIYNFL